MFGTGWPTVESPMYMTEWQVHWALNLSPDDANNKRWQEWIRKGIEEGYIQYYATLEELDGQTSNVQTNFKEKIDGKSAKKEKHYPGRNNVFERRGSKAGKSKR